MGAWTVGTLAGHHHDWPLPAGGDDRPGWDGWRLDCWGEDHRPHAARADGRVAFPDRVDLRPALRSWRDRLDLPPFDPDRLRALAARMAPDPDAPAVITPAATVPHTPSAPTPDERGALSAAFAGLLAP